MILLISSKYDLTTNKVARWLKKYNANYFRLNTEEYNILDFFSISNNCVNTKIDKVDFLNVNTIWHRRGRLRHIPNELNSLGNFTLYLKKEEDALIKSIELYYKESIKYIGSYLKEIENYKLFNLLKAKEAGFKIPKTLVTTSKFELHKFIVNNRSISKDIRYAVHINTNKELIHSCGTFEVKKEDLDLLDENFAPILVQEYVEKKFEIRVFLFEEKFFSMAIFSQNDEKTKIDFRNYNEEKPNRCVPFKLPKDIDLKLRNFKDLMNIETGSIDIIYSMDKEYIFLEVNPMGQFDWLSKNCNYNIEEKIALSLIENDTQKN